MINALIFSQNNWKRIRKCQSSISFHSSLFLIASNRNYFIIKAFIFKSETVREIVQKKSNLKKKREKNEYLHVMGVCA